MFKFVMLKSYRLNVIEGGGNLRPVHVLCILSTRLATQLLTINNKSR